MEIEDKKCHVKSYEQYEQQIPISSKITKPIAIDYSPISLKQPPVHDSPQNILNALNDDCLLEIFKNLHYSTLLSVANVCNRFICLAKEAFSCKYKSKEINILELEWNREPTLSKVEHFLRVFGSSISILSVVKKTSLVAKLQLKRKLKNTNIYLKLIEKYCKNINELEICFKLIDGSVFNDCLSLFKRLKKLKIPILSDPSFFKMISVCSELEVLDVNYIYISEEVIPSKFALPKLVELRFCGYFPVLRGSSTFSFMDAMSLFIKLHPKLKILQVPYEKLRGDDYYFEDLHELNIQIINLGRPIVQKLNMPNFRFKNLNLTLSCDASNINLENVSKLGNITTLHLQHRNHPISVHKLIPLLELLPNLKTFSYRSFLRNFYESEAVVIKTILEHANQLTELTIFNRNCDYYEDGMEPFDFFPNNDEDYGDILKLIENRKSRNKVIIIFLNEFNISTELKDSGYYPRQTDSIHILNGDLLTIRISYSESKTLSNTGLSEVIF